MSQNPTLNVVASLIDNLTVPLKQTASTVQGISSGMKSALEVVGVTLSAAAGAEFFKSVIEKAAEAEKAITFLRQAVNNAGQSFGAWEPAIEKTISGLEKVSTYSHHEFVEALTRMVAKSGDMQGSLANLGLVADVAAYKNIGLAEAGDLVGKAMTGNGRVFKEFGITAGTTAEKMQQLKEKTKGYAEDDLNTLDGQLKTVKRSWDELEIAIGTAIVTQGNMKGGTKELSHEIDSLKGPAADVAGLLARMFVGMVEGLKGASKILTSQFLVWYIATEKFVGEAIVVLANIGIKGFGWMPVIGDKIKAAAENAILIGNDMVTSAEETERHAKEIFTKSQKDQTQTAKDEANNRTKALTKEEEAQAKAQEAATQTAKTAMESETQALLQEQKKLTDQFTKDFGEVMPAAVTETKVKINDLGTDIAGLRAKQATAQAKALEEYKANNQAAGDFYNMEATKIGVVIDKATAQKAMYEKILPVYQTLAGYAKETLKAESDPNPYTRLQELNTALDRQNFLHMQLNAGSHEEAELNKQIGETKKAIAETEKEIAVPAGVIAELAAQTARDKKYDAQYEADILAKAKEREAVEVEIAKQGVGLAHSMGIVSDEGAQMLNSAIGIGQALAHGDMVGAIAGFGGILSSLFGQSPENAARKALVQHNNEQLAALVAVNGKLVNLNAPGAKIAGVQGAINDAHDFNGQFSLSKFASSLASRGLAFGDVQDIAKSFGIDLGTGHNQLVAGLGQLGEGLNEYKPTAFASGLQGTIDAGQYTAGIAGGTLGLGDFKDILAGANGSPALEALFSGLDLSNPADLATLKQRAQMLSTKVNNLSNTDLGGLSIGQFTSDLSTIAGLIPSGTSAGLGSVGSGSLTLPTSSGSIATVADASGWGLKDVSDAICGRIDTTNDKLDSIIENTGAIADAVGGGRLLQTINTRLQDDAGLTNRSTGVTT